MKKIKQACTVCIKTCIVAFFPSQVMAAQAGPINLNQYLNALVENISSIPAFITTITYILGILLAIAGVFKLKEAVDNPGQNSIQDGFIRLAAGGALIALPTIVATMGGTFSVGGMIDNTTYMFEQLEPLFN
jgi:hypothetical protein